MLRASGIDGAGAGFFCDPLVAVVGRWDREGFEELAMQAGHYIEDPGIMVTDMAMAPEAFSAFLALSGEVGSGRDANRSLVVMVKIRDAIDGAIHPDGRVERTLSGTDLGKLERGTVIATDILTRAGATDIMRTAIVAAHPGGSARIGDVVDTDLATEIDGLYVCDCSVLPRPWGLPPTLTLICLAKRLAEQLADRLAG